MGGGGTDPGVSDDAGKPVNSTTPPQGGGGAISRDSGAGDSGAGDVDDTIMKMTMFRAYLEGAGTLSRLWELLRTNESETMHGELHLPELFEDDDDDDDLGRRRFFDWG